MQPTGGPTSTGPRLRKDSTNPRLRRSSQTYVAPDIPEVGIGVLPALRGLGVGKGLVRALLSQAQASGIHQLSLSVEADNAAARKLYSSVGFSDRSFGHRNHPMANSMLTIRTATADDAGTIPSLNHESHEIHAAVLPHIYKQVSCEGFPSPCEAFPAKQITEILADPNDRIFMAYWDEEPVGYLYCQIQRQEEYAATRARHQVYIHLMSINRSHQRKGIGTADIPLSPQTLREWAVGLQDRMQAQS